jgi:pimeloyl-ACP methyl ester carboxylesterase
MSASTDTRREPFRCRAAGRALAGVRIRAPRPRRPATLVFLHEGLGSVSQWRDFPDVVCGRLGMHGLVYDRWGHGLSEPFDRPRTVRYLHDEAYDALPEVLHAAGIGSAVLVGHSDGGSIALLFAARHPELTAAVVSEAAHVFVEEMTLDGIRAAVRAFADTALRRRLARHHREKTDSVFSAWADCWLSPEFRHWNIEADIRGLRSPLLLVQGEADAYGSVTQLDAIEAAAAGPVERLLLPDCGHVPHHERRDEVVETMAKFVERWLDVLSEGRCDSR